MSSIDQIKRRKRPITCAETGLRRAVRSRADNTRSWALVAVSSAVYAGVAVTSAFAEPATHPLASKQRVAQAAPAADGGAQTQLQAREPVHIGTIRTRPGVPETRPDDQAPTGPNENHSPDELYQRAMNHLHAGRILAARRNLELLVARHPDTPLAHKARAELAKLFARKLTGEEDPDEPSSAAEVAPSVDSMSPVPGAPSYDFNTGLSRAMGIAVGDRVFFAPGSAKLGGKARGVLRDQVNWLKRRKGLVVLVEGHADEPGDPGKNLDLSLRRAAAVRDRLIDEGLAAERIQIEGLGHSRPIANCTSARCSAQNRRVVTRILKARADAKSPRSPTRGPLPQTH